VGTSLNVRLKFDSLQATTTHFHTNSGHKPGPKRPEITGKEYEHTENPVMDVLIDYLHS
jgi:hypothetical protein